jgi:hypothetical protein
VFSMLNTAEFLHHIKSFFFENTPESVSSYQELDEHIISTIDSGMTCQIIRLFVAEHITYSFGSFYSKMRGQRHSC